MKILKNLIVLLFVFTLNFSLQAQQKVIDSYDVALSNPNEKGLLKVNLHNGTIEVKGYKGKEVIIEFMESEHDDDHNHNNWDGNHGNKKGSKYGLKKIPSGFVDMEIEEENNTVYIKGSHNRQSNLVIQVPEQFALQLKAHHNGDIKVSNVVGELEITTHHGGIEMEEVGGSVIADTHHGGISVSFVSVTPNKPMAFSTYHGDVDITLPSSVNCATKIKTAKGDIYTDFDLALKTMVENKTSGSGRKQIKIGGWMYGNIGSGGEEFLFNTHHGDVVIRKL